MFDAGGVRTEGHRILVEVRIIEFRNRRDGRGYRDNGERGGEG